MPGPANPWASSAEAVLHALSSDGARGLSSEQVSDRRAASGPNALREKPRASALWRLLQQFSDVTVLALLVAALVSVVLGTHEAASVGPLRRFGDAIAILAIVLLNAGIGFAQENRAHSALSALKSLVAPSAVVLRNAKRMTLPAVELVPGDVVLLEEGARVPADVRICEQSGLEVSEAVLTGESVPVAKSVEPVAVDAALGDRSSMMFMATHVRRGSGTCVVTATGMDTEMGQIAGLLASVREEPTPLEREMRRFGLRVVTGCVVLSTLLFLLGWWRGHIPIAFLALTAVSLAVAAIPEGLPAITTVVLAQGVRRMAQGNALVRRLSAVETLGAAQIICSDKTGTLTQNRMAVTRLWAAGETAEPGGASSSALEHLVSQLRFAPAAQHVGSGQEVHVEGDPTDVALLEAFDEHGAPSREQVERVLPFSEERRLASVAVKDEHGAARLVVHGAPEPVLSRCVRETTARGSVPLSSEARAGALAVVEAWASDGLRVLAFAERPLESGQTASLACEHELSFVGLVALSDPARPEVFEAIERARKAGVVTLMITGDHARTAAKIATELGILDADHEVVTGPELDRLSDAELPARMERVRVVARATARDKLRVVQALQTQGKVVAMTGDGVNDAPAIKAAAIGIAMGKTGTDVTRDVAELVLADDNYATIVRAIHEGRSIYAGIQRFVAFLFAANLGLVLLVTLGLVLGWPALLTPTQILWINLVTNGLPALAIGTEPMHDDPMAEPPRATDAALLGPRHWIVVAVVGSWFALLGAILFHQSREILDLQHARTLVFSVLSVGPLAYALSARGRQPITRLPLGSSRSLLGALLVSLGLQAASVYVPGVRAVFDTVPLEPQELAVALLCSVSVVCVAELLKVLRLFP